MRRSASSGTDFSRRSITSMLYPAQVRRFVNENSVCSPCLCVKYAVLCSSAVTQDTIEAITSSPLYEVTYIEESSVKNDANPAPVYVSVTTLWLSPHSNITDVLYIGVSSVLYFDRLIRLPSLSCLVIIFIKSSSIKSGYFSANLRAVV